MLSKLRVDIPCKPDTIIDLLVYGCTIYNTNMSLQYILKATRTHDSKHVTTEDFLGYGCIFRDTELSVNGCAIQENCHQ